MTHGMKSTFRIHLSTAIVLMLTASAMLWANFASPVLQSIEVVRESERYYSSYVERTKDIRPVFSLRGWPLSASPEFITSAFAVDDAKFDLEKTALAEFPIEALEHGPFWGFWEWQIILINMVVCGALLFVVWYVLDWRIRRTEANSKTPTDPGNGASR